jgi:hypothetical protein
MLLGYVMTHDKLERLTLINFSFLVSSILLMQGVCEMTNSIMTFSIMTLSITTLILMTLSITTLILMTLSIIILKILTFRIKTLSILTLSMTTLSINGLYAILSIDNSLHNNNVEYRA